LAALALPYFLMVEPRVFGRGSFEGEGG